jgi:hypothetical protein
MCTYWVDKIDDIWIVSYCWQINKKNHIITETVIHFKHLPGFSFSRVNEHARFTTILVASNRLDGQQVKLLLGNGPTEILLNSLTSQL